MSRLIARLAAVALVSLIALSLGASYSRAEPIAPYLAAASEDALWYEVSLTGQAWPDTFPAEWAKPKANKVSVAARTLPALRAVGVLTLGPYAFELGWKIGRVIDTKWLHLSGSIGEVPAGPVTQAKWYFRETASWGEAVPANVWVLRSTAGANYDEFCNPAEGTRCTRARPPSVWEYATNATGAGLPGTLVSVGGQYCGNSPYPTTCTVRYVTEEAMENAVIQSFPVPYTTQPWGRSTAIPAPVKNATNLIAARNKITELGEAVQNEYNASLDPGRWARPGSNGSPPGGLITDWTMPDCRGVSIASCQSAITSAAAAANAGSVTFSEATATVEEADLSIGPNLAISTSPAAASVGRPATVTITKNPDPLPVVWSKANLLETYSTYLARLRDLGWLGTATVIELNASTGDVDYGLDGVPCTSVRTGSRITVDTPVTFLRNPTMGSFDDGLSPSSGPTCGDATPTSESEPECSFFQEHGSWATITRDNPLFYQVACESTRSFVASLNPFEADGTINMTVITIARDIAIGDQIYSEDLRAAIAGGPYIIEDFKYASSQRMVDDDGREFELHFFVNTVTGKAVVSPGFKIRWVSLFGPS